MNGVSESEILQGKFFAALARNPPATWYEIWTLCWEDRWFQAELVKQSHCVLSGTCGKADWLYDTCHEAMLILGAKLKDDPSLGLAPDLGDDFPAVVGTIIRNASRQAFRRLRRIYRTGEDLTEEIDRNAAEDHYKLCQQIDDIGAVIDGLAEPLRTVLRLFQVGYSIGEISKILNRSPWSIYRAIRQGLEQIRRSFSNPETRGHRPDPGA